MIEKESIFDKRFYLFIILEISLCVLVFGSLTIFVLLPEKQNEINELKNMSCLEIKEHLANEDYGWVLNAERYNSQYIWKCTK